MAIVEGTKLFPDQTIMPSNMKQFPILCLIQKTSDWTINLLTHFFPSRSRSLAAAPLTHDLYRLSETDCPIPTV